MRYLVVLGLLFAVFASPASAADLGGDNRVSYKDDAPYYSPRFNWTGGYVGLQFGYGWGDVNAISGPLGGFDQSYGYSSDGIVGGAHAGYNFQMGNVVYGLETDLELTDQSSSGIGSLGSTHQTDIDWQGSLRARVGYAMDRTLLYVTGGWAFADVSVSSESGLLRSTDYRNGWTLGGGLEYAFSEMMTARLEYRYTDYGVVGFNSGAVGLKDETDLTTQTVRAGISVKF